MTSRISRRSIAVGGLLAGAALLAGVLPAKAASRFSYVDSSRDTLTGQAAADILQVTYEVKTLPVGASQQGGTQPHLVVTMDLSAPPEPGLNYQTDSEVQGCGGFGTSYAQIAATDAIPNPPVGGHVHVECSEGSTSGLGTGLPVVAEVSGATITWAIPFDTMPPKMLVSRRIMYMYAFTQPAEPVSGHNGPGNFGLALDYAKTYRSWVFQ